MNGYFRLISMGEDFGLEVIPPTDGDESVTANEVAEFLASQNIAFTPDAIKKCVANPQGDKVVLGNGDCPRYDENYTLRLGPDNMVAMVRFYPPSDTGIRMTMEEFMKDMKFRKITVGLDEDTIASHFREGVYCTDLMIAIGKNVRQGTDARIEYLFNTDVHTAPSVNEDGSVDYFNLHNINHCKKGEVLARIIKEDPGDMGINVLGGYIKPREVKRVNLKYGRNIELSEDKLSIISMVDGHVMLVEDKVFVSDVFEVDNVDVSTGNIEFEGSILIKGNVLSGFSVKSAGNVEVNGFVEGAMIEAGGDIIIKLGINGMGRGMLKAGGNVICKFIENAAVMAGGYVTTDSILHSNVSAGTDILVESRKGFITGGRVSGCNKVRVRNLGSNMGAPTVVETGVDPVVRQQFMQVQREMLEAQNVIKNAQPILTGFKEKKERGARIAPDQIEYVKNLAALCEVKKQELLEKKDIYLALQEKIKEQSGAVIEVLGEVYPGTTIVIKDTSTIVQSMYRYCKFSADKGEIRCTGL